MNIVLENLRQIDPANDAIRFIECRILRDDYRGLQVSQHNHYDRDMVVKMLKIMFDIVGDGKMQIRTSDLSKRPYNVKGEEKYAEYVNKLNREFGRCTQDSVRKNLFIELHRMGFIDRFKPNLDINVVGERSHTKFVSLTKLGQRIINANIFKQNLIYTEGIDKLFQNHNDTIFEILLKLSPQKITIDEMMYFVSFIGKTYEEKVLGVDEIVELVNEYRRLTVAQKRHLNQMVQNICDPNKHHFNKIDQRDYHNWRNEEQQIFTFANGIF